MIGVEVGDRWDVGPPFGEMKIVEIFIYYGEPLLYLARGVEVGETWIVLQVKDEFHGPRWVRTSWLFVPMDKDTLSQMKGRVLTLREGIVLSFQKEGVGYVCECGPEGCTTGKVHQLTDEVLPLRGTYP